MRVVVDFDWEYVGDVGLSAAGRLVFPSLSSGPAVYRFVVESSPTEVYIGETENLRQRMEHNYRYHPGSTNVRVRDLLVGRLEAGHSIRLALMRDMVLTVDRFRVVGDHEL
jgi:hypothetical protein